MGEGDAFAWMQLVVAEWWRTQCLVRSRGGRVQCFHVDTVEACAQQGIAEVHSTVTGLWGREACVRRSEQQLTCVRVMVCGKGAMCGVFATSAERSVLNSDVENRGSVVSRAHESQLVEDLWGRWAISRRAVATVCVCVCCVECRVLWRSVVVDVVAVRDR